MSRMSVIGLLILIIHFEMIAKCIISFTSNFLFTFLSWQESLAAVEEVMNGVCASVYRPVDCVLKALFTSPCELVSDIVTVCK